MRLSQGFWGTGEKGDFISRKGRILREKGNKDNNVSLFPSPPPPPGEQVNRYPLGVCWLKKLIWFHYANSEGSGESAHLSLA